MLRKYGNQKSCGSFDGRGRGEGVSLPETNKQEQSTQKQRSSENHETKEASWNGIIGRILEDGRIYTREQMQKSR